MQQEPVPAAGQCWCGGGVATVKVKGSRLPKVMRHLQHARCRLVLGRRTGIKYDACEPRGVAEALRRNRRRDCHFAAPTSPLIRYFNRMETGDVSKMTVSTAILQCDPQRSQVGQMGCNGAVGRAVEGMAVPALPSPPPHTPTPLWQVLQWDKGEEVSEWQCLWWLR